MSNLSETQYSDPVYLQNLPYQVIRDKQTDSYEEKVVQTYCEEPEHWRKAIGDTLLFQFGVYEDVSPSLAPASKLKPTASLDESSVRYFEQQLFLAGVTGSDRPAMRRILDIGCGWGYILKHLAERYPECRRLDGVNVSAQQLNYCARLHAEQGLANRINLFLCNAQDIGLLPDPADLYDLVIIRGVISHFPNELYEKAMRALFTRVRPGGKVIISDNLYNVEPDRYQSDTPDMVDRLACRHQKTPAYFSQVLEDSGFGVKDFRVLPSNVDVAHWLMDSKANIERHFPEGVGGALEELRILAENWSVALLKDKVSTYSVIAQKPIKPVV
ncbi:Rebeccamycin O-methyltransferase [Serratia proteamaculans]|uniref:Methyltransferase domain-containing protein n=1 Tax=Serratia proteamaculans TaxID=28151 RepID=A0ABS0TZE5_SERPR|nr:class I SAM-dependent methyltransferase [Serratia proteamaculans]KAB1498433.1 methyltransferase domain-containing protein [Serratia proteamaculans]MBI6182615.1 methyltransferase domain-containing protein [Serratia proteamaculans]RYM52521.1 methyltransferase type 12 [Serratia proteamaculans]CAI0753302.1 Rebeccamycin O-methyltransferase [Serratia proteamaculans]CAI0814012.1 Rebeccamycin O-methyltransferase [Serratia proteamaculans]